MLTVQRNTKSGKNIKSENRIRQIERVSYWTVTLLVSLTKKWLTWEQTEKEKNSMNRKQQQKRKGEQESWKTKAKKILEKHAVFCKGASVAFTWALSAVCALQETQTVSSHIQLQLCMHNVHMKSLYAGPRFGLFSLLFPFLSIKWFFF